MVLRTQVEQMTGTFATDGAVWTQRDLPQYSLNYTGFAKRGPLLAAVADASDKLVFSNDGINFDRPTTCKYNLKHVEVGGS